MFFISQSRRYIFKFTIQKKIMSRITRLPVPDIRAQSFLARALRQRRRNNLVGGVISPVPCPFHGGEGSRLPLAQIRSNEYNIYRIIAGIYEARIHKQIHCRLRSGSLMENRKEKPA